MNRPDPCDRSRACLVLMLKAPQRSKTRLAAQIGPSAGRAAELLLACALEDAEAWPGPVCYAPASAADAAWLSGAHGPQPLVVVQRGDNLGRRLNHVNEALRALRIERQLFIGTDCPELDLQYLLAAEHGLADRDAVIGPARDGGAVLIGARRALPDLAALPWSTGNLGAALVALVEKERWTTAGLTALTDVDEAADLLGAAAALAADRRAARRALCAWVRACSPLAERVS